MLLDFESITRNSGYSDIGNCSDTFSFRVRAFYSFVDCVRSNGNYLRCCCGDDITGKTSVLQTLIGLHCRNSVNLLPSITSALASVYAERISSGHIALNL